MESLTTYQDLDIKPKSVVFTAIFNKATTTVDGGWNVSFSLSQDEAEQVVKLSQIRDKLLQVAVVPQEGF